MRKYTIILAVLALLLLTACEKGGKFRVVNRTSHNLYATVGNQDQVTIPGGGEYTFEIDTPTEHFFTANIEKEVPVRLVGETYQIYDDVEEMFVDTTTVIIRPGQTLPAYIDPNRASIKIVNNSSVGMTSAMLYKHNFINASVIGSIGELESGSMTFRRVDYATPNNNFYYYVSIEMADGRILQYGGEETVLQKGEQFLITLVDPPPPPQK